MRSHRFYTPIDLTIDATMELPSEAAHHCTQVLRYKVDDPLTLFNGDGFNYSATIFEINKKQCSAIILEKKNPKNESPLKIHLLQGIARGDKMDFIIQKAVELGVTEITPVFTQRSNVKLDEKRLEKKHLHWNKTIISACEQSGRAIIPKLNTAIPLNQIKKSDCPSIYLEPDAIKCFFSLAPTNQVNIVIG
ncbi:MAG: 16S rRNA (uracil(1498)-N(3))-methyltransferase, partial [Kangiellaceae bacterium]|nr:16S rRNA (uracil(1498)-N(3))-methyltransferase [Kangiellaceae bacterium]